MTEKRFTLVDDYLIEYDGDYFDLHKPSDIRSLVNIIKYVTDENEQLYQSDYVHPKYDECRKCVKELFEKNEQLKEQIEYQGDKIVDAIDSLMELPSVTIYLLKQWLDAFEEYDSIEDMKNTFSERLKELEE